MAAADRNVMVQDTQLQFIDNVALRASRE